MRALGGVLCKAKASTHVSNGGGIFLPMIEFVARLVKGQAAEAAGYRIGAERPAITTSKSSRRDWLEPEGDGLSSDAVGLGCRECTCVQHRRDISGLLWGTGA